METVRYFIFLGSKITADGDYSHEIKRHLLLGRKAMTPREHINKQRHYFADKGPYSQSYGFFSSHVQIWELDYKESWTVLLEKTLEIPLECKEIKLVSPKGNQSWIFIGRTDAEAPILWPPDAKNWLISQTLMLGKIEGGRRRGLQMRCWMASPTQWTWVWVSSRRWRRTGKPGVLQSMRSQRVWHNLATEQQK